MDDARSSTVEGLGVLLRDPGVEVVGAVQDAAAEAHYVIALGHVVEPVDRVRILERLAAVRAEQDAAAAAALLGQADTIRRARRFAIAPVDRALTDANRRRLVPDGDGDGDAVALGSGRETGR